MHQQKVFKKNEEQFLTAKERLDNLIKAVIARDLYSFEAFWIVMNSEDEAYQKALNALQDDTFRKLKIAEK